MAPWSLPMLLLLHLQLHGTLTIVSATTTVHFYLDDSCESVYATVKTDTNAGDGQCGEFATSIYSASSVYVDDGCSGMYPTSLDILSSKADRIDHADYDEVTTYSGSRNQPCSNDATFVPTGLCTSMSIGSYSVDCMGINGTHNDAYRTLLAEDMTTRSSVAESSTSASTYTSTPPIPQTSSSQHDLMALESAPAPSPLFITPSLLPLPQDSPSSSSPSSLASSTSSPPSSLPSSSPSSSPPSSSPPSSSPSQTPKSSGTTNDGGLSGPSTIAIGVVLPGVAVVVAVIFGVLGVKRWREKEERNNSTEDGERGWGTLPPPPPYQEVLPPLPQTTAA